MGTSISAYVDEDLETAIERIADHHDITESTATELLLREGLNARALRSQQIRIEANLDALLEDFVTAERIQEYVDAYTEQNTDDPLQALSSDEVEDEFAHLFDAPGRPFDDENGPGILGE
jgi:hypothetical protein